VLAATGRAWPNPDLRVAGHLDGDDAGWGELAASHVDVAVSDLRLTKSARGSFRVDVEGAHYGTTPLGSAHIAAHGEGSLAKTTLEIDWHRIGTADGAVWTGSSGRITLAGPHIAVEQLHATSGPAEVVLDGDLDRVSHDLRAKLGFSQVALAAFSPGAP